MYVDNGSKRIKGLPSELRQELIAQRRRLSWTQRELGVRVGLPQMHISGIETGKIIPRFDTLLDLVRILSFDLLLVPRSLVPAVQALVQGHRNPDDSGDERPLYALPDDGSFDDAEEEGRR